MLAACGRDPDRADVSPFFLWGARPGLHIDSVGQILTNLDNMPWATCKDLGGGFKRCERDLSWVAGTFEAVAVPGGRVIYIAFAPALNQPQIGLDRMFDDDLSRMQQQWAKTKGVRMDPHGVSEANPRGIAEFSTARGRWKALMTFDGRMCSGTERPCTALVQLVDWPTAESYARLTVR
jgi:hypothetical protein